MPKISVIVPVFDCKPYLETCIDSILSQNFRDFELILVDDGSRDGSGRILDDYAAADSRIRVIHQENGGPAAARNTGLDAASCPYVYFPDSDDVLDSSLLGTAVRKMDDGWDMVVFGFDVVPPPEGKERDGMSYPVREEQELLLETDREKFDFLTGPFRRRAIRWEVWNRVFRRDVIEKWGIRFGCDRRIFAEDMYFTYFYTAHISRILLLPDRLYTYRKHDGSESGQYGKHLMIYSSSRMTEEFYAHCRGSEDCGYLAGHFLPMYFLLHKGALRRLRRYQWKNGLGMEEARRILKENVVDYPAFYRIMTETFTSPVVQDSYRKDRGRILQLTDRLYTEELLELPGSSWRRKVRRTVLQLLYFLSSERTAAGRSGQGPDKEEKGRGAHV